MKNRFSTIDVFAVLHDLKRLEGLRVANIYNIDQKTYLIKLQHPGEKRFIIFESGIKIYITKLEWPKAQFPSSFSMKLRKHIKQKRLIHVQQLGIDRVVDMQFGSEEFACHVLVELYDRGNVVLTDHTYTILNVLRRRTDKDADIKIVVKEKYPLQNIRQEATIPSPAAVEGALKKAKGVETLKRVLSAETHFGPALLEHCLLAAGFEKDVKVSAIHLDETSVNQIMEVCMRAREIYDILRENPSKGYLSFVTQKRSDGSTFESYEEFHPFCFKQFCLSNTREFSSFSDCLDEFFSNLNSQKADLKTLAIEREARKKLDNVRKDHEERIRSLALSRTEKEKLAYLLESNCEIVNKALLVIRSAIANQMTWEMIEEMKVKASKAGDPVASIIADLDLNSNAMTLLLRDSYDKEAQPEKVTIDIGLSAHQNARKLHHEKKAAGDKEQKTIQSSAQALKSAQQKTKQFLETIRMKTDIVKSRQLMWFEKFYWFISSEDYLVIGGRDAQQNELLVKRYLRPGDIYVHADVRGASSVIIRNKSEKNDIPPKTLNEAGVMAVCYSSAWEAKVSASAWWVYHHQVSRTAPSGEYLSSGSFMIRGKKNQLPLCQLVMGFGLLFKLDDDSFERRQGDKKVEQKVMDELRKIESDIEDKKLSLEVGSGKEILLTDNSEEFPDVQLNVDDILGSNAVNETDDCIVLQIGPGSPKETTNNDPQNHQINDRKKETPGSEIKKNRPMTKREKHKAAKIKKKYRDQDEEERKLRLMLLASKPAEALKIEHDGNHSQSVKKVASDLVKGEYDSPASAKTEVVTTKSSGLNKAKDDDENEDENFTLVMEEEDTKMLNSLTWQPYPTDNLLYAVVEVAPYSVVQKFKFKTKLIPGTGKKGKAAKSAIALFQKDKSATMQELSLLRVLSGDESISRNIPGKVKVSAKQLNRK